MKIFLLVYDRRHQHLSRVDEYEQTERTIAYDERQKAEVRAMRESRDEEIVILEAESLKALKRTHGSYFYTVEELTEKLRKLAS
jgi:hypothetical protein